MSSELKDLILGMLERDPAKRWDMKKIKSCNWINAGYHVRMDEDEANMVENVMGDEIQSKGMSIRAIAIARKYAKKLSSRIKEKVAARPKVKAR